MGSTGITTSRFASREEMNALRKELNYHLPEGAESIDLVSVADIDRSGYGTVEYDINYRIPYTEIDSDGISHTRYDYKTETRTERMKVR